MLYVVLEILNNKQGESPMRITMSIVILLLVCCGEVEAESKLGKYVVVENETPVILDLDDMTFDEAFAIEHRAKGEGRTFWWNGNLYSTNLAETIDEFVLTHSESSDEKMRWVLNNDDPDDDCYYNRRDICGVCNGPGKITWWRDKDGDGLGDHREYIKSCDNPNTTGNTVDLGLFD
mgnify:CR=1 FL=1|tara:strand:- start:174 stop:704 length:531 start_codon:yes stop_codon:yes gene_type:complete